MPIYEFYCKKCNTIYKFLSSRVNTNKSPNCPHCRDIQLERKISLFNTGTGAGKSETGDDLMSNLDESKMEKAMNMLAREAEHINDDDPRQASSLMRKLSDVAGLQLSPGMEDALSRIEQGEDPDKVESEMSELLESEDPFVPGKKPSSLKKPSKPAIDDRLYKLD